MKKANLGEYIEAKIDLYNQKKHSEFMDKMNNAIISAFFAFGFIGIPALAGIPKDAIGWLLYLGGWALLAHMLMESDF